jgi:hypothetical protein
VRIDEGCLEKFSLTFVLVSLVHAAWSMFASAHLPDLNPLTQVVSLIPRWHVMSFAFASWSFGLHERRPLAIIGLRWLTTSCEM